METQYECLPACSTQATKIFLNIQSKKKTESVYGLQFYALTRTFVQDCSSLSTSQKGSRSYPLYPLECSHAQEAQPSWVGPHLDSGFHLHFVFSDVVDFKKWNVHLPDC